MTERKLGTSPWLQRRDLGLMPSMVPSKHSARITRHQQEVMTSKLLLYTLTCIVYSQLFVLTPNVLSKYVL